MANGNVYYIILCNIMYIANYILVNIINIKDWPLYNRQLIILMAMFTNFGTYDHNININHWVLTIDFGLTIY